MVRHRKFGKKRFRLYKHVNKVSQKEAAETLMLARGAFYRITKPKKGYDIWYAVA